MGLGMSTAIYFICPKCSSINPINIPIDTDIISESNKASFRSLMYVNHYGSISVCYKCKSNLELQIPDQPLNFKVTAYDPNEFMPGI